jgi:hypothetical protein
MLEDFGDQISGARHRAQGAGKSKSSITGKDNYITRYGVSVFIQSILFLIFNDQ